MAAAALAHLGVSTAGLDGVPLGILDGDPFGGRRAQLRTRCDETAVPAAAGGFTHTPPAGWPVDNSRMGSGCITWWAE
ncbi:hypothetical protein ACIO7M_07150 [Streptomyces toxytricini]|uniref:Uncharacterized protein n=1 Tax=Streptomyces toxytricini TaxID=67369 RepID=A0ABW8EE08_STRT5